MAQTPTAIEREIAACHCCGQIQYVRSSTAKVCYCARCLTKFPEKRVHHWSRDPSVAFALAALILYFPAILLPVLKINQFGQHYATSLLGGTWDLLAHGNWFVGTVVLLFSIVLPFIKLLGIFELTVLQLSDSVHRAWVYRFVEGIGRWGMLDVLLLALMVMLVKVGDLIDFEFGPAVIAFAFCVMFNMLASIFFNPHAIWTTDNERI